MPSLVSKHTKLYKAVKPQLFVLVGAFILSMAWCGTANAQSEIDLSKPVFYSKTNQEIKNLDITFEEKNTLFVSKKEMLEKIASENKIIDAEKRSLDEQVKSIKSEIADLQQKIADKKKFESDRKVPNGRAANDSQGNLYAPGNCTYYVKEKRPDLSNSLGNANQWYSRAQSLGYKVGNMAKEGAVGTTTKGYYGHVVYVEKWLGDGKILVSEMNASGLWSVQTREADESEFLYIYQL